jgi:dienelactone hydrolase
MKKELQIPVDDVTLKGDVGLPENAKGLIIFSHGSGSSRLSPRNRFVASSLKESGFGTLLFDLLTPYEDQNYEMRFNIELLTNRLVSVTRWMKNQEEFKRLNIGYFGASTGAASALRAAAVLGSDIIKAVVSRGGRPDLAEEKLKSVKSPTLLLVGGLDTKVIKLNEQAFERMNCKKELTIIPGASHLFEETGKLEEVTRQANDWFLKYIYRYQKDVEKDFID